MPDDLMACYGQLVHVYARIVCGLSHGCFLLATGSIWVGRQLLDHADRMKNVAITRLTDHIDR